MLVAALFQSAFNKYLYPVLKSGMKQAIHVLFDTSVFAHKIQEIISKILESNNQDEIDSSKIDYVRIDSIQEGTILVNLDQLYDSSQGQTE